MAIKNQECEINIFCNWSKINYIYFVRLDSAITRVTLICIESIKELTNKICITPKLLDSWIIILGGSYKIVNNWSNMMTPDITRLDSVFHLFPGKHI